MFLLFWPGVILGAFLRALLTRILATIWHFPAGLLRFSANWSALVTTVDLRTPPDLIPGLPENSAFNITAWIRRLKKGSDWREGLAAFVGIPLLFGPTYLFHLTLKSTFLLYRPLLFIASAPKSRQAPDGSLQWDDTLGRTLKDKVAFALALIFIAATFWSIYQPGFYASYAPWGAEKGLPKAKQCGAP